MLLAALLISGQFQRTYTDSERYGRYADNCSAWSSSSSPAPCASFAKLMGRYLPAPIGVLNVDTRFHHALTAFWFLGAHPRASMQRAVMRSTLFL